MPFPGDDEEISYLALDRGTPVLSSSGNEFGTVEHVLQVPELDLFDGIVVRVHHAGRHSHRFVDRDQIDKITRHRVRTLLTDEQAENLPAPTGTPIEVPEGPRRLGSHYNSIFGRMFGREHWRQVD
jgi:hypothetical protein